MRILALRVVPFLLLPGNKLARLPEQARGLLPGFLQQPVRCCARLVKRAGLVGFVECLQRRLPGLFKRRVGGLFGLTATRKARHADSAGEP